MSLLFNHAQENVQALNTDLMIVFVNKDKTLSKTASLLNQLTNDAVLKRVSEGDLLLESGKSCIIYDVDGIEAKRLALVCAESAELSLDDAQKLSAAVVSLVKSTQLINVHLCASDLMIAQHVSGSFVEKLVEQFVLDQYQFTEFKAADTESNKLAQVSFVGGNAKDIHSAIHQGQALANGKNLARNLGNLPPNVCHPTYLAETAQTLDSQYNNLTTKVLDEQEMDELGMHSMLSVGNGSEQPSKLIVMEYKGADNFDRPYALVGKGVTFDSGGISIKPGAAMDEMKFDMCGAASVFGAVRTVAELELPINLVAVVGAVENMPSHNATRPGDVVKSMSGKTIEILNTDAEGRLVLCDCLTYVQKYNPKTIIDIATLTGAIIMALGDKAAGLFSNDDNFAKQLIQSGEASGDRVWQLPIWPAFNKQLKSNFADLANIGTPGAGSITAACFLSEFVKDQTWAHIDIAGVAWNKGDSKGATGKPVALLVDYLSNP